MVLFVLTFVAIYGAMHALLFWGLHPLLKGHPALPTLSWIWMGLMVVAPILVRLCDRAGFEALARGLAWVGYSWMGFCFIGFCLFALAGVWELLIRLAGLAVDSATRLSIHGPQLALLGVALMLGAGLYGLFEARDLMVERVRIATGHLPSGMDRLVIAQVSDLHLGLLHRDDELGPIVTRLLELKPDLVVATGDIVDAQISHLDGLSALWRQIDPPLGKYAVTGNHEFYAGLEQAIAFLEKSGFTVLRNRAAEIAPGILLLGVDDPAGRRPVPELQLLDSLDHSKLRILLKHRPKVADRPGLFDLQLSGHTHRGQIFPFNLLTGMAYPLQDGLYPLSGGGYLYTSRGTGSWGPPMRIGARPELTLIELVRK